MASILMRLWWRLLALALYTVLVAGAFWVGFELGLARTQALVVPECSALESAHGAAVAQIASLQADLAEFKQEGAVLERSRQIERETNRSLQAQLKEAQDERLALIKESSYLKRLVQEGGKGAVRVHDLRLTPAGSARAFRYSFTVTQLISDFGESRGAVQLHLKGVENAKETTLSLEDLPEAAPKHLSLRFEYFQNLSGEFVLPDGFEPRLVTLTIDPEGDLLAGTSEAFPWIVDQPWSAMGESENSGAPARP